MKKMNLTGPPVSLDKSVRDSQVIINDRKYIKKGNWGPNTKHTVIINLKKDKFWVLYNRSLFQVVSDGFVRKEIALYQNTKCITSYTAEHNFTGF